MPPGLNLNWQGDDLSLLSLLYSLLLGALLSLVLRWHFKRFGSTLTNREEFAQVFPFIVLTTVLIISVVKSSLALSLGLVGALSIVRFRTPIKEPEELAYLFMSIAMGLGLGANRALPTVVASMSILTFMAFLKWSRIKVENKNLHLSIDWHNKGEEHPDRYLERLNEILQKHLKESDLRRLDTRKDSIEASYIVSIKSVDGLSSLVDELRGAFPAIGVTFIDQNHLPSV